MKDSTVTAVIPGPFDDLLATPVTSGKPVDAEKAADIPPDPFTEPSASPSQQVAPARFVVDSVADPFADILGDPISGQMAQVPSPQHAQIPDDFDPMGLDAVSSRNTDNPLQALERMAGEVNEMFTPPSVDTIYAPSGTPIEPMIQYPLEAGSHGRSVNVDTTLDPLVLFAGGEEESLLPDAYPAQTTASSPASPIPNHGLERNVFFRAPAAPESEPLPTPTLFERLPVAGEEQGEGWEQGLEQEQGLEHEQAESADSTPKMETDAVAVQMPAAVDIDLDTLFGLDHSASNADRLEHILPSAVTSALSDESEQAQTDAPLSADSMVVVAPALVDASAKTEDHAQPLLDAFKQGLSAGGCEHLDALTPELMHTFGQMLAASARGCVGLLQLLPVQSQGAVQASVISAPGAVSGGEA